MFHYVGLDVLLKQTSICVVEQAGSVVREGGVYSDLAASQSRVRANQFPFSVNRAETIRPSVLNVSIPSRARSATVTPDVGLVSGRPCQAPCLFVSAPALKQAMRALRLAGDKFTTGARGPLGNRGDGSVDVGSLLPLDSPGMSRRIVSCQPPVASNTLGIEVRG